MPSPDAFSQALPSTGTALNHSKAHAQKHYKLQTPPSIMSWRSHKLAVIPPQPAGWVSPPSPTIRSIIFQPATVEEARPAPPSPSSLFSPYNSLTLIQKRSKEHHPPITASLSYSHSSAHNSRSKTNSLCAVATHTYMNVVFPPFPLLSFIIEGLT